MKLLHPKEPERLSMTTYTVQFVMPVDNPVNKVSVTRSKGHMVFEVPINHPDAHQMGLMQLIGAAELSGLLRLSPGLKNKIASEEKISNNKTK